MNCPSKKLHQLPCSGWRLAQAMRWRVSWWRPFRRWRVSHAVAGWDAIYWIFQDAEPLKNLTSLDISWYFNDRKKSRDYQQNWSTIKYIFSEILSASKSWVAPNGHPGHDGRSPKFWDDLATTRPRWGWNLKSLDLETSNSFMSSFLHVEILFKTILVWMEPMPGPWRTSLAGWIFSHPFLPQTCPVLRSSLAASACCKRGPRRSSCWATWCMRDKKERRGSGHLQDTKKS